MENVELQYKELKHKICSYIDMINSIDKETVKLGFSLISEDEQLLKFANDKINLHTLFESEKYIEQDGILWYINLCQVISNLKFINNYYLSSQYEQTT